MEEVAPEVNIEENIKNSIKALKKENKTLKQENEKAQQDLENMANLMGAYKERIKTQETQMNQLILEYTRITNYIKQTTNVFYQSILMAIKEGNND